MKPEWYRRFSAQLRAQPPEVKSHIALIAAGAMKTLIALVWVTTLPARFATIGTIDDGVASSTELMMDTFSPLLTAPSKAKDSSVSAPDTPEEVRERIGDFRRELEVREEEIDADIVPAPPPQDTSTIGKPVLIEVR